MSANVSILGNLGSAPETRFTPDGTFVANFSIASNSVRNSPNGKIEETNWYRVTAFGNQARTLKQYAKKGSRLLVQGKLTCQGWLNREGVPQVSADVLLQDFQFTGGNTKEEDGGGAPNEPTIEHLAETEIGAETEISAETEIATDVQVVTDQVLSY